MYRQKKQVKETVDINNVHQITCIRVVFAYDSLFQHEHGTSAKIAQKVFLKKLSVHQT